MNEPLKTSAANLQALPGKILSDGQPGGKGPPPASANRTPVGLLMVLACGLLLVGLSGFALAHDPAAETYSQYGFSLGSLRVSFEMILMTIGCACTFTPLTLWQARFRARKIERASSGQVKSMKAKRLDKVSDQDVLSMIGKYIANLLRVI